MNPLAAVIAQVESSNFPYAMRFEPALFYNTVFTLPVNVPIIQAIKDGNRCDHATAHAVYSTSYGLFQILGMNLYEVCKWKLSTTMFCYDGEAQLNAFADFCSSRGIDPGTFDFHDEPMLAHFARTYNGPGDIPNYVAKMKAAYAAQPHA